jgi:hypothetical protein
MRVLQADDRAALKLDEDLLARLLCYGVQLPPKVPEEYRARYGLDASFIQGSIFLLGGTRPINTMVWGAATPRVRGIPLVYLDDQLWLEGRNGLIRCSPLEQPSSINEEFSSYGRIANYLKFHNRNTVFASPIRECIFGAIGQPCQFCTFEMTKPRPLPPSVFTDMFLRLTEGRRRGLSLAIGPGTPNLRDHGARYIRALLHDLNDHWRGPTSVELVPPNDLADLENLIEDGVGSVIMSIEIWDDDARQRLCPGKSYVSKEQYIDAWRLVTNSLGHGKVSSVLLVGLESSESTKNGINFMTEMGVVPTLIPFRPYERTPLSTHQVTDHKEYMEVSRYNITKLKQQRIGPHNQVGCTACGGCSLEIQSASA